MKRLALITVAALLLAPLAAQAQGADTAAIAAQKAAIDRLAAMRGVWRGPASAMTPAGEIRMTQTERVGPFLGGTLMLVEGKAFLEDGSIGFNAFATISYDVATKSYWMDSHAQGRAGRFEVKLTDTGWSWDIPAGPAKIHYAASFAGGIWSETGDYLVPGQPPRRIFTMQLTRVGDTAWPAAGGVARE